MSIEKLDVEIAYATPEQQLIKRLQVDSGTTARAVVALSGLVVSFPEIDVEKGKIGVFGKAIADDYVLQSGDRVEIYRPLLADPKAARRARASR